MARARARARPRLPRKVSESLSSNIYGSGLMKRRPGWIPAASPCTSAGERTCQRGSKSRVRPQALDQVRGNYARARSCTQAHARKRSIRGGFDVGMASLFL